MRASERPRFRRLRPHGLLVSAALCQNRNRVTAVAAASFDKDAINEDFLTAEGHCSSVDVPDGCKQAELSSVDWERFLGLICRTMVKRAVVAQYALDTLAYFTKETAEICLPGLVVTLFVILGSGALQWNDQVVRFMPDGSARFLIGAWQVLGGGRARYNQFSITVPHDLVIPPPFPPWTFPGLLEHMRDAQDFTSLRELPKSARCDAGALSGLEECGNSNTWHDLLKALCSSCAIGETNGLPCYYDGHLLGLMLQIVEGQRDRSTRSTCPHGLVAILLALGGRSSHVPAEVHNQIWRMRGTDGRHRDVLHARWLQVMGSQQNRFSLNVPMMDLAPFPFHTGALRSARLNDQADVEYYEAFLGAVSQQLSRMGVEHILVPGDHSAARSTHRNRGLSSLFVPIDMKELLAELLRDRQRHSGRGRTGPAGLLDALKNEFGGIWRLARVAPGLWQIGEEPYRFSPSAGVAYRVFCKECVYVSIYFYARDGTERVLPLAPWIPCLLPREKFFPARTRSLGGTLVPSAADAAWLRRMQRPPTIWVPDDPVAPRVSSKSFPSESEHIFDPDVPPHGFGVGGLATSCRDAWRQALRRFSTGTDDHSRFVFEEGPPRGPPSVSPEFDLSAGVYSGMGLFDLMRQREDSEQQGLRRYSDKILFKTRLLREGIAVPAVLFMSSRPQSHDLEKVLHGLNTERFVAKPTHLAATSFVYVMRDGINLVSGRPTTLREVAAGLDKAQQDRHVDDWATEFTAPGIIIEALVEPSCTTRPAASTPDELKCHTFFGELFFCEWVFVKNMTTCEDGSEHFWGAHSAGDRAQPSLGHKTYGIPNFEIRGFVFRDGSCFDCEEPLPLTAHAWKRLVDIVERLAADTDHIRIDMFITPDGDVVVNEANISFLKISKLPPDLVEEMGRRWLDGYRLLHV